MANPDCNSNVKEKEVDWMGLECRDWDESGFGFPSDQGKSKLDWNGNRRAQRNKRISSRFLFSGGDHARNFRKLSKKLC